MLVVIAWKSNRRKTRIKQRMSDTTSMPARGFVRPQQDNTANPAFLVMEGNSVLKLLLDLLQPSERVVVLGLGRQGELRHVAPHCRF